MCDIFILIMMTVTIFPFYQVGGQSRENFQGEKKIFAVYIQQIFIQLSTCFVTKSN